jgi:hypothetical protein
MEGPTILFLAGLALTCGVLLFRTHRQLGRRPKGELPSPAGFSRPASPPVRAHRLDAPSDVRHWEVEMRETARELCGQLDSKISIMQHLIRDARQQAERLEALLARAEHEDQAPSDASNSPPAERAPSGHPASPAARRHAEIYTLADAGLSSAAIASRLASPIGEVELILGLRQRGVA